MTRKAKKATKPAKVAKSKRPLLSDVQRKIVEMMKRANGASRAEMIAALPGSEPAYLAACIYRILPAKGIKFKAERQEGAREVRYKIA